MIKNCEGLLRTVKEPRELLTDYCTDSIGVLRVREDYQGFVLKLLKGSCVLRDLFGISEDY